MPLLLPISVRVPAGTHEPSQATDGMKRFLILPPTPCTPGDVPVGDEGRQRNEPDEDTFSGTDFH
jgi:hypothetical protein